jgi:hypothetical protein
MSTIQIDVTEQQFAALKALARNRRTTPEQIVKEAVDRVAGTAAADEQQKLVAWREAALRMAGMWKDRDDLPDFAELRKSWDRGYANRE